MKYVFGFIVCLTVLLSPSLTKASYDQRPSEWCGWQMRQWKGGGPELNLARNWAKVGSPLLGPTVGAVVVWPHHVGLITGRTMTGEWIVKSGNDGHRVRERPRSVAGAIAFRMVSNVSTTSYYSHSDLHGRSRVRMAQW